MGQIKTMAAASLMAVMTFVAVSCGPSAYTLSIETSRPSASGVDLAGKTVSVVYMDNGQEPDSLFAASMASAFVMELEDDYFGGDSLVPVFCLDKISGSDYFSKSSMAELLVEAGTDVLFLLDSPVFGTDIEARTVPSGDGAYTAVGTIPFSVNLYAYDSMDKRDTVLLFSGSSSANVSARINGTESREGIEYILKSGMEGAAATAGSASGRRFAPEWKSEDVAFFLYDSAEWYDSYYYVNDYQWQKAMDIWMSMLDTPNLEKKACLEYNMAAACYLQGQYKLASDWLEMSKEHFSLPYVRTLEEKISSRL